MLFVAIGFFLGTMFIATWIVNLFAEGHDKNDHDYKHGSDYFFFNMLMVLLGFGAYYLSLSHLQGVLGK